MAFGRRLPASLRRRVREMLMDGDAEIAANATTAIPILPSFRPGGDRATIHATRDAAAAIYLRGEGIELAARHEPLRVPPAARVKYVDRMTAREAAAQHPDLAGVPLVDVDIIDNDGTLAAIGGASQDFVVANHFLEHCQNPFLTLQHVFRVLRPGGVIVMTVPDKRYTADADRPCTTLAHLTRDYVEGPGGSKRAHFEEWSRLVNKRTDPALVDEEVRHLMNIDYSIHFHVWGAAELLEFILALRDYIRFEPELFLRNGPETLFVLRKVS